MLFAGAVQKYCTFFICSHVVALVACERVIIKRWQPHREIGNIKTNILSFANCTLHQDERLKHAISLFADDVTEEIRRTAKFISFFSVSISRSEILLKHSNYRLK